MNDGTSVMVSSRGSRPQFFIPGTIFRNRIYHDERYVLMSGYSHSGEAQLRNMKNGSIWEFGRASGITNLERLEVEPEGENVAQNP